MTENTSSNPATCLPSLHPATPVMHSKIAQAAPLLATGGMSALSASHSWSVVSRSYQPGTPPAAQMLSGSDKEARGASPGRFCGISLAPLSEKGVRFLLCARCRFFPTDTIAQLFMHIILFYKELLNFERFHSQLEMSLEPDTESRRYVVQEDRDKDREEYISI